MAMSSPLYGIELNRIVWIITVILNITFIIAFGILLFGKNKRPGRPFI
ncbi:MAG: hypothetical protein R2727_11845 [Bacteroidales bacterium]